MENKLIQINHVCSLGTHCQSSDLIKDLHLKQESYPFDWIFSSPVMVINTLKDDFSQFLNR